MRKFVGRAFFFHSKECAKYIHVYTLKKTPKKVSRKRSSLKIIFTFEARSTPFRYFSIRGNFQQFWSRTSKLFICITYKWECNALATNLYFSTFHFIPYSNDSQSSNVNPISYSSYLCLTSTSVRSIDSALELRWIVIFINILVSNIISIQTRSIYAQKNNRIEASGMSKWKCI